jgi:hypothetical protein
MDGGVCLLNLLDPDAKIKTQLVAIRGELDEVVLGERQCPAWVVGYLLVVDLIMYFHSYSSTLNTSTWYLANSSAS